LSAAIPIALLWIRDELRFTQPILAALRCVEIVSSKILQQALNPALKDIRKVFLRVMPSHSVASSKMMHACQREAARQEKQAVLSVLVGSDE
jgi:hypothetical protein